MEQRLLDNQDYCFQMLLLVVKDFNEDIDIKN